MIQSILEQFTILASNESAITFTTDDIRTKSANCCGWLQHNENSPLYKILEGGLYEISFNGNISSATAGTTAIALYQDGQIVPGTTMIVEVATAGDFYNISFDKVLKICCRGDATLTIQSVPSVLTGTAIPGTATDTEVPIVQNLNILIVKKA